MTDEALLLDTCAFLDWAFEEPMSKRAQRELESASRDGRAHLSPLSVQETLRIAERGKLDLPPTALSWTQLAMRRMHLAEIPFTWDAAFEAGCLHSVNADPVDRGLLATAIVGGLTLVTRDDDLLLAAKQRGVRTLDTRP
jgi:PIN domain nuclease of toxin-antitoxin system